MRPTPPPFPTRFIVGLALGLAAGLTYAWLIQPVHYYDLAPDSLRQDYRTDYVLMVAQGYQVDGDLRLALIRLASLGATPPAEIVAGASAYAEANGFAAVDRQALEALTADLERLPSELRPP